MKEVTHNEYNKAINRVIDYVNSHLQENIDLNKMAELSNISEYHFHRIFKTFIGESFGSYTNRLRLERAAGMLRMTKHSLTKIAEKTGYSNQQSLSKAFKKHFGLTPSAFRNIELYFASKQSLPKIESLELEPEIRIEESKKLIYIRVIAEYDNEKEEYKAWEQLWEFSTKNKILNGKNELLGISLDDPRITKKDRCRYYACITTDEKIKPHGNIGNLTIDKGKFAVFTVKGAYSQLNEVYDFIYQSWVFTSKIELRDHLPFEKYLNTPKEVEEDNLLTEIYIPII